MRTWTLTTLATLAVILLAAAALAAEPACKSTCKTPCASAKTVTCAVAADGDEKEMKVEVVEKDGKALVKVYEMKDGKEVLVEEYETDDPHKALHIDGDHMVIVGDDDDFSWHALEGGDHANAFFFSDDEHNVFFGGGAFLGVQMQDLNDQLADYFGGEGVLVSEVVEDSPAEKAGLKAGDVITKMDDETIGDPSDIQKFVGSKEKDDEVEVTVLRKGKDKTMKVTLGEREGMEGVHAWVDGDENHFNIQRMPKMMKKFKKFPGNDEHEVIIKRLHTGEMDDELDEMRDELKKLRKELEEMKKNK